ncbi:MAG: hypothetical protein AAGK26_14780 [Pseudomonadota bacterium]
MAKTLKDLLLALLNATLLLVALCLFLAWQLITAVQDVTSGFSETLQRVAPLREDAQAVQGQLAELRTELAAAKAGANVVDDATAQRLNSALDRLEDLENNLQSAQSRLTDLAASPDVLIDQTLTTAADVVADRIIAIRGCVSET